LIRRAVN